MSKEASSDGEHFGKHLARAFVLAVVFYVAGFYWIEHRRVVKGPWNIVFVADASGHPSLEISQTYLKVSERLDFPSDTVGVSNISQAIQFNVPTTNIPFGENVFQDALYLPGTVTLRLCGHLIEVVPRTLVIDKTEHPWQAGTEILVQKP